jgi:hypothetical protein
MATTMNLIAKQTIGSAGAASVTFSSIPQTFTDLKLVISSRGTFSALGSSYKLSFNGSDSNFSIRALEGAGSGTPSSFTGTQYVGSAVGATATASTFNNGEIYIPNYTSTANAKSFSVDAASENNGTEAYADLIAGLWNPGTQAAITSLALTPTSGNFTEFSEFAIYGISSSSTQNQTTPSAIGGDIIRTDGTYWYHQFLYSGTFTPLKNLTCDYLVVAGGGGGGSLGGGGGGGGLRSSISPTGGGGSAESALSVTGGSSITVTVGAGGVFGTSFNAGSSGVNSVLSTITSTGGGGGGANGSPNTSTGAKSGGSGGGAGNASAGASGEANQGFGGGSAPGLANASGSGGGGAGAAGTNSAGGTNVAGGAGGTGVSNSITGSSVAYAGGGGGGGRNDGGGNTAGGSATQGGGAGGSSSDSPVSIAGTANTGGGGGGGGYNGGSGRSGANGGSGIVIVRYAV